MCGGTSLPLLHPCLFSNLRLLNINRNPVESLISPKFEFLKFNSTKKSDLFHFAFVHIRGWRWIILKIPSNPDRAMISPCNSNFPKAWNILENLE